MKYKIWRTNRLNETILTELVAEFEDLELAKDFVEYQATIGEYFAILEDGHKLQQEVRTWQDRARKAEQDKVINQLRLIFDEKSAKEVLQNG